jgi:hypothetical protein
MTKTEQTRLWTWRFKVLQRAGESSRKAAGTRTSVIGRHWRDIGVGQAERYG